MAYYDPVVPTPRSGRRMLTVRASATGIAAIEAVAAREDISRSDAHRLLLAYACQHMPPGWRPARTEPTE